MKTHIYSISKHAISIVKARVNIYREESILLPHTPVELRSVKL